MRDIDIKCFFGFHDWTYNSPHRNILRQCKRCNKIQRYEIADGGMVKLWITLPPSSIRYANATLEMRRVSGLEGTGDSIRGMVTDAGIIMGRIDVDHINPIIARTVGPQTESRSYASYGHNPINFPTPPITPITKEQWEFLGYRMGWFATTAQEAPIQEQSKVKISNPTTSMQVDED